MSDDVRWTNKFPLLAAGLVLIIIAVGWMAKARRLTLGAIILMALGLGFVGYSATIKDWCELEGSTFGQSAFGSSGWGGGFGTCLKAKGYLSF